MKMRVYTRRKTFSIVRHVQNSVKDTRYALVNILIESDFVMFNRRIIVTKDTVSNIISNGFKQLMSYIKNVFC